jgi:hypothetical protein
MTRFVTSMHIPLRQLWLPLPEPELKRSEQEDALIPLIATQAASRARVYKRALELFDHLRPEPGGDTRL